MADGDLTTAEAVADFLGTTVSEQALLADIVTGVSAQVPNALNRGILTATYTETRRATGGDQFQLRNWPVQSIAKVEWSGFTLTDAGDPFAQTPGVATDGRSLILVGYTMPGSGLVRVTYTAGWDQAPADIKRAVTELAAEEYTRRTHIGETSHSANGTTTVAFSREAMHAAIREKLSSYLRVAPLC